MLQILPDAILSIIYPQACGICTGEVRSYGDGVACSLCWEATTIFDGNETLCTKCGAFLFANPTKRATFCRRCDDHFYDRAFAIGLYEKALAVTVLALKHTPNIPGRLKKLVVERASGVVGNDSLVVMPVPLSRRRERERGFNQAGVLANLIGSRLGVKVDRQTVVRRIHTPVHRAGMDEKARAMSVKNAFEVVRPNLIEGRDVLLVDDVLTSGATVSVCAQALKKSGAASVTVMTIARAA